MVLDFLAYKYINCIGLPPSKAQLMIKELRYDLKIISPENYKESVSFLIRKNEFIARLYQKRHMNLHAL